MKMFDVNGRLSIPNPGNELQKDVNITQNNLKYQVRECYCQNGHNLINHNTVFNGLSGIMLKIKNNKETGYVALSPEYGNKSKVAMHLNLINNDICEFCCPHCNEALPVYSNCSCGGSIIALFSHPKADFANCIGICNRVGCFNSTIRKNDDLVILQTFQFETLWFEFGKAI